ncbi:MAG: 4a-hydroxytetrahydrobiopterin dehydratase [Phycisphaerae bacterium]|nr:4a-hydroxytetrahydrobiopterin dehydratase [Phycisphaerae bacterium]
MAIHTESLAGKHCVPCHGGSQPLRGDALDAMLRQTPHWELVRPERASQDRIVREFTFADFRRTLAFVNRVAELADAENHHPHISFTYSRCRVELWTHAVNGLSENDFILAAKIDQVA